MAAWTKWTNAHGGVDGHPVQFIADTEPGNVAVAVTDVQKLIAEGVTALIHGDSNDAASGVDGRTLRRASLLLDEHARLRLKR